VATSGGPVVTCLFGVRRGEPVSRPARKRKDTWVIRRYSNVHSNLPSRYGAAAPQATFLMIRAVLVVALVASVPVSVMPVADYYCSET
jgi:hypothetical protein